MKKLGPADYRIKNLLTNLMCQFDVKRTHHKNCVAMIHYIIIAGNLLEVSHDMSLVPDDFRLLMTMNVIRGTYVSESQRATLKNRILEYLEKKS